MTKQQYESLKVGDIVVTNGQCGDNRGIKCKVTYICDGAVAIERLEGERQFRGTNMFDPDWDEKYYTSLNIVK